MADVEKVARAIDPDAFSYTSDVDGSLVAILRRDNAMKAAQRALAAMGEREGEPVAWQYFDPHDKVWEHCDDPDHFRNELGWQVRPLYASPRPEAEIARLTEARRKDAEAFESVRNANTIVRTRAKDAEALVERYRIALADAIRRPMGVIPGSAEGLVTANDLDAAEERRQERESSP